MLKKEKMLPILEKIRVYDRIMIFRHTIPDGDCVGASKGLKRMLQLSYPEKQVLIVDDAQAEYLSFLGPDDAPVDDAFYRDALAVVVDTGSAARISNQKYALCREKVKIDHHPDVDRYAQTAWVEEDCSSACEMIAALYDTFAGELKIDAQAATCIFLGMVTDSGRFRFPGVNGDTLRYAARMLDAGVDTQRLYAQLYLRDFASFQFEAYVLEHLQRTENGVAYLYVDRGMQEKFALSFEDASACIGYMDSIKGCLCWLAFIDAADGSIRVRLRSRFVTINALAERFHGGGHACASGATVYSGEEMQLLIAQADELVKEYKVNHSEWL